MVNIVEEANHFKVNVMSGNLSAAETQLQTLKVALLELDSLPPMSLETPNAAAERTLARDVYEHAVVLAIKNSDKFSFQSYMSILSPYYTTLSGSLPPSNLECSIVGLHLLYLLVENQLSEFHSKLELLTEEQLAHPAIAFCTQLDQHLMMGSYDQVMQAAAHPPVDLYSLFLTSLSETVRVNICECIMVAYKTLPIDAAREMLMFNSCDDTLNFLSSKYPELEVNGGVLIMGSQKSVKSTEEKKSQKLIHQTLSYAAELERIV